MISCINVFVLCLLITSQDTVPIELQPLLLLPGSIKEEIWHKIAIMNKTNAVSAIGHEQFQYMISKVYNKCTDLSIFCIYR